MDFNDVKVYGKKTLADVFKDIYENSKTKERQISELVKQLQPMITNIGDATMLVPLLKEYIELGIKNDEQLIKMAAIVQRAMAAMEREKEGDVNLSDKEKADLLKLTQDYKSN